MESLCWTLEEEIRKEEAKEMETLETRLSKKETLRKIYKES
jgi:hypothetical protein